MLDIRLKAKPTSQQRLLLNRLIGSGKKLILHPGTGLRGASSMPKQLVGASDLAWAKSSRNKTGKSEDSPASTNNAKKETHLLMSGNSAL